MPDLLESKAARPETAAKSLRVVMLMNVIAPYHKPLLDKLAERFGDLRILLSTPMESNRPWNLEWAGLNVSVQRNITLHRRWRHPQGFSEPLFVHVPVDTLPQLFRLQPDVVISWEMGARTILASAYRRMSRSKLMVWAEFAEVTEYGRGSMRQMVRRSLHHGIDGFLVTGASGARYLQAIGVPARKLYPIVYTTEVERFAAAGFVRTSECRRHLLFVGQLIERKGLLSFIDVAARWSKVHPGMRIVFTLVGDGPLRARLENYPAPPNLELVFRGNLDYEDLPAVYAQAGIFVFPSLADTWGVVVNEALSAGLPVLGSLNAQAVSELVEEGHTGWTFRPDRTDEMYAALDRALTAPDAQVMAMRQRARETALRLTPAYMADLVQNAIVRCVSDESS